MSRQCSPRFARMVESSFGNFELIQGFGEEKYVGSDLYQEGQAKLEANSKDDHQILQGRSYPHYGGSCW